MVGKQGLMVGKACLDAFIERALGNEMIEDMMGFQRTSKWFAKDLGAVQVGSVQLYTAAHVRPSTDSALSKATTRRRQAVQTANNASLSCNSCHPTSVPDRAPQIVD